MPLADPSHLQDPHRLQILQNLRLFEREADPAFDRLTRLASRILNAPISLVSLLDAQRQFFKSHVGLPEPWATLREVPLTYSFCQHVVASGAPLIIEDTRLHPLVSDNPAIHSLRIVAYAGMPLKTSDGYTLGSLCVVDSQPRQWKPEQIEILADLAMSVMTELELRIQMHDLENAEVELLRTYLQLSELEQLKTDMINIAAHDLKNPLSSVLGGATMLLMHKDMLSEKQQGLVKMIETAGHQMERIINDILSLQRIEDQETAFERCNLSAVVRERYERNLPLARQKQVDFQLTMPDTDVFVCGDTMQLREAIDNLVTNAIKYTPAEGSVTMRLSLPQADEVLFEVVDTGYGIPAEQQARLFQPFYRVKTRETIMIEGTGLGLHLVKKVISRLNGAMRFHSVHGQGSMFGFTLPIIQTKTE